MVGQVGVLGESKLRVDRRSDSVSQSAGAPDIVRLEAALEASERAVVLASHATVRRHCLTLSGMRAPIVPEALVDPFDKRPERWKAGGYRDASTAEEDGLALLLSVDQFVRNGRIPLGEAHSGQAFSGVSATAFSIARTCDRLPLA